MKIVISRKWWFRSQGSNGSRLIRVQDGKMCCMGFAGLAYGVLPEEMLDSSDPLDSKTTNGATKWPEWFFSPRYFNNRSSDCKNLIRINDEVYRPFSSVEGYLKNMEEQCEMDIIKTFKKHGDEVVFED